MLRRVGGVYQFTFFLFTVLEAGESEIKVSADLDITISLL